MIDLGGQFAQMVNDNAKKYIEIILQSQGQKAFAWVENGTYKLCGNLKDFSIDSVSDISNAIKNAVSSKEISIKEMNSKGSVSEMNISDVHLKEFKKQCNKEGVNFSILKNAESNNYTVVFESKNLNAIERCIKKADRNINKKIERKESIHKKINDIKEYIKDNLSKNKELNKELFKTKNLTR